MYYCYLAGIDLGIKAAVILSTGESIKAPSPLKAALRRLQIRGRTVSRKYQVAKKSQENKRMIESNNRQKFSLKLAKLHAHIVNLRADFIHKLTTRLS